MITRCKHMFMFPGNESVREGLTHYGLVIWPVIWRHESGSTLAEVMACCLKPLPESVLTYHEGGPVKSLTQIKLKITSPKLHSNLQRVAGKFNANLQGALVKKGIEIQRDRSPFPYCRENGNNGNDISMLRQSGRHFADDMFKCKIYLNMFQGIQSVIRQHKFSERLGTEQATRHYLNHWWFLHKGNKDPCILLLFFIACDML